MDRLRLAFVVGGCVLAVVSFILGALAHSTHAYDTEVAHGGLWRQCFKVDDTFNNNVFSNNLNVQIDGCFDVGKSTSSKFLSL